MNWKATWGILVVAWSVAGAPAGEVVTAWNFNGRPGTNAPAASTGVGRASLLGGVEASFASGAGSTDPEVAAADEAWNLTRFPARSDSTAVAGAEFRVDTTGFGEIRLQCDLRPSNTASRRVRFQYSVDGDAFVDGPVLELLVGGVFTQGLALDLGGVAGVGDNPRFAFRVVAVPEEGGEFVPVSGRYSPSGTWRLDMVTVLGTRVGTPQPVAPPEIRFVNELSELVRPGDSLTNSFGDLAVGPGERLEIRVEFGASDTGPHRLGLRAAPGLPEGSGWVEGGAGEVGERTGLGRALFRLAPQPGDAGATYDVEAVAMATGGTNRVAWRIHVPTEAERGVVLTEFLANPSSSAESPAYNPLRRDPPSDKPGQHDEFLELVNLGEAPVDLRGWRVRDATGWRHVFRESVVMGPSNALILQGGPAGGAVPGLDVPVVSAGEGVVGLSLNNDGDAIALYNASTNLVFRVVYTSAMMAPVAGGLASLARLPDGDGGFVASPVVGGRTVTPGRRADGRRFDELGGQATEVRLTWVRGLTEGFELGWVADLAATYAVQVAGSVAGWPGGWVDVVGGLVFPDGEGRYRVPVATGEAARFFRVERR